MRRLRSLLLRLVGSLGFSRDNRELVDELDSHLQHHIDDNLRAGMLPGAARRDALMTVGGVAQAQEQYRDRQHLPLVDACAQNLRYAFRSLRNTPAFTGAVVLTIALGSGANAAIFSIFNQALLRILPVPAPEQLVNIVSPGPRTGRLSRGGTFGPDAIFSYPLFRDLEREQDVFTGIAAYRDFSANVAYDGQAFPETGLLVSGSYFPVLATPPSRGRLLGPEDDRARDAHPVVVVSHAYWQTRLQADPGVLNESLVVNGQPLMIVGVAPEDFLGTTLENRPSIFVALSMAGLMMPGLRNPRTNVDPWNGFEDRRDHWLYLFARLKPGISRTTAEQALNIPFAAMIRDVELPAQQGGMSNTVREQFKTRRLLLEAGAQGQRPERAELNGMFLLLFCVTGIVFLLACANVANLMLARAVARERDIMIRLSLGAARRQLVVQMLTESFLLAVAGSLGGLIAARSALRALASLVPEQGNAMFRFQLDSTVLLFGVALSVAMPLLFGLYPALIATRRDVAAGLRSGAATGPRSAVRFRTALATVQLALSLALLVTAGLFTKSLLNLSHIDLGMRVSDVTTFRVSPALNGYSPAHSLALFDRVEQELLALPGVTSVGASTIPVLAGIGGGSNVTVEGFRAGPDTNTSASSAGIGPGYFRTVGIPLLGGREFTSSDTTGAPKVAVVNEAFARKFGIEKAAVGRRMFIGAGNYPFDIEIVGLVRDARYSHLKLDPPPLFFLPYRQLEGVIAINFYVQSTLPAGNAVSAIRVALNHLDPILPVENLRSLTSQVGATVVLDRLISTLSLSFAALATLLAATGLYGVLAYNFAQRTRELALRMALGANPGHVRRIVFGQVGWIAMLGGTVGAIGALALGRLAESQLFQVPAYDPVVTVLAAVATLTIALGAGLMPAYRAAHIEPAQALRCD